MTPEQLKPQRPKLGDWRMVRGIADRHSLPDGTIIWGRMALAEPVRGIYIGYRHVYNGILRGERYDNDGDYESGHLQIASSVETWLFVTGERKAPLRVLPVDAEAYWKPNILAVIAGSERPFLCCVMDGDGFCHFPDDDRRYSASDVDRIYAEWLAYQRTGKGN